MTEMKCVRCDAPLTEVRLFCSGRCRRESNKQSLVTKGLLYEPLANGAALQVHALLLEVRRKAGDTPDEARGEALDEKLRTPQRR